MNRKNVGQIRTIEAFLAVLIVFSSFAISSSLPALHTENRSEDLASIGFQALMELDTNGRLGEFIDYGNWSELRDALSLTLPPGWCFNLTVFDDQMQQVNTEVISNGGFSNQQIAFVEYLCSSQGAVSRCYVLHLLLAVPA